jgi:cyclopropane fatty-acyl-phospholipid synthase-like methyltransferase
MLHNYPVSVKVVEVLGKEKAIEIFRETKKIEEDGGMMVLVCSLHCFCVENFVFCLCKCMAFVKLRIMLFHNFVHHFIFRKL